MSTGCAGQPHHHRHALACADGRRSCSLKRSLLSPPFGPPPPLSEEKLLSDSCSHSPAGERAPLSTPVSIRQQGDTKRY